MKMRPYWMKMENTRPFQVYLFLLNIPVLKKLLFIEFGERFYHVLNFSGEYNVLNVLSDIIPRLRFKKVKANDMLFASYFPALN